MSGSKKVYCTSDVARMVRPEATPRWVRQAAQRLGLGFRVGVRSLAFTDADVARLRGVRRRKAGRPKETRK